jgi:amino acid permease
MPTRSLIFVPFITLIWSSLFLAVLTVTIAVSLQDRPASAPQTDGLWVSDYKIVGNPSFTDGITAICNLVFAFSGTPGFFAIISEMRDPRKYTFALLLCQVGVTSVYLIVGCIVYFYCGSYVSSPALGSAGGDMKKIAYGFALPGLIVTTTICSHVSSRAE